MDARTVGTGSVRRLGRRLAGACVAGLALVVAGLAAAGPASAHVRPDPSSQATAGAYGVVRLVVPDESADASTVRVAVTFPKGVDLTSARTLPVPGWTAKVETEQSAGAERVTRIVWQADSAGDGLTPTEFGVFTFSAGKWPVGVTSVTLPTEQTYSDGTVVAWDEVAVDGASEPEHPAPSLTLTAASGSDHADDDDHGADATGEPAHAGATAATDETSISAVWGTVSVVSLLIALGAVAAVVLLARRVRRSTDA